MYDGVEVQLRVFLLLVLDIGACSVSRLSNCPRKEKFVLPLLWVTECILHAFYMNKHDCAT